MLDIVSEIAKHAKSVAVALPKCEKNQNNADIYFSEAEEFLTAACEKNGIKTEKYFSNQTSPIKENLFSFTLGDSKEKTSNIKLFQSQNELEEAASCCSFILDKVRSGAKFSDFNIILADGEHYEKVLERALGRSRIPHFFDRTIEISSHALSKFIISLINCFYFDLQSQFVLELSKSYYLNFSPAEFSDFENYVFKYNVEGGMFLSKFFDENAEKVREKLSFVFDSYKTFKKQNTASAFIDMINVILAEIDVENKNYTLAQELDMAGDFENAKITQQILEKIHEALDDINLIFKNVNIDLKEFREMLLSAIKSKTISLVPIKTQSVYIGDIKTSYFAPDKINIVLGASFGAFPQTIKDVGIISDDEIKLLKLSGKLEPTIKQLGARAMFKCFEICSDAKELVLSFAKEVDGENKTESLACVDLKNIFDIQSTSWPAVDDIISAADASMLLAGEEKGSSVGKVNLKLNNNELAITSLEKYFDCPLKFALLSGVKIKERESGIAKAFDIGNIYHEFMYFLMGQIDSVNSKNVSEKSAEIINKVLGQEKYKTLIEVEQNKLIIKNIKKECVKLAKNALIHSENSAFKANKKLLEVSFGNGGKLSAPHFTVEDKNYYLKGKIDRVDTNGEMARIIDYKTGSDKFSLADGYYGKKIQLISYAACMQENGYDVVGAYYFPLKNEYRGKDFIPKLDGITLKDLSVIRALDLKLNPGQKSNLINVALKQDGNFNERLGKNTLLSAKEFDSVQNYVKKLSAGAIGEIEAGFAEAWPSKKQENMCSCDFCPFKNSYFCIDAKGREMAGVGKNDFLETKEESDA